MPGFISKVIPSQDADKKGMTQFIVVVVFLDGTCPSQSSNLSIQVVPTGLSTETLEGP
jgi:hypothetical protein